MRNLEKGQHIFIAFQNGKAVLDSQLRPRMYTSLENAERWTPPGDKGKIEYVEYAPTFTQPNEPLTLDDLREMDGKPVWWDDGDGNCWGIVTVDADGFWAGIPFLRGRRNQVNFEYNIKLNRMKIYRRPPEGEEET